LTPFKKLNINYLELHPTFQYERFIVIAKANLADGLFQDRMSTVENQGDLQKQTQKKEKSAEPCHQQPVPRIDGASASRLSKGKRMLLALTLGEFILLPMAGWCVPLHGSWPGILGTIFRFDLAAGIPP
jgi:hypothetical protein